MDLSGVQLTVGSASVLSDVFTIEWGLRKLVFKECDLDEHVGQSCARHLMMLNPLLDPQTYASFPSHSQQSDVPVGRVKQKA